MKKFINFIITLILFILICLFFISFNLNKIVINTISKQVVGKEVSSNVIQIIKDTYDNIDYETLDKIEMNLQNSENVDNITEKYLDSIINSIINNEEVIIPNTKSEIINLIDENEYILKKSDIEINDTVKEELIDKIIENKTLDTLYKNVSHSIKNNLSDKEIMFISIYNKICSSYFRMSILSMVLILTLILALIKKTYYRWTYNLSVSFALSGIFLSLILPKIFDLIFSFFIEDFIDYDFHININSIINSGYICFSLCALFIIIYIAGNKITNYNSSKYNY